MILYHGTSTKVIKDKKYLLPASTTSILRESRKTKKNYVFLTDSQVSAGKYAKKAVEKFGGNPIILQVDKPIKLMEGHNHEFICTKARIK